jgi:transposase
MLLLGQGWRHNNFWWKDWEKLSPGWPAWLVEQLESLLHMIEAVNKEVLKLTREVRDWGHFNNRREIGSYSGLTGGVSGSGEHSADLSITKAGNRRLSSCLIECAWRMLKWQPDYWLVKKWKPVQLAPEVHVRRRKKAIVAFARQLLIDVWKWKRGKATPQEQGWAMT